MELDINDHVVNYLKHIESKKARKKIIRWLNRLETEGYRKLLGTRDIVKIETDKADLFELRIQFNNILYRLFFIITNKYQFIHAYDKHVGEKTPQKEIDTCLNRIKIYKTN